MHITLRSFHRDIDRLTSNGKVSEEEPPRDEGLASVAGGLVHDVQVWWVEAQSGGGQAVSHQIDPKQLNWNERFREAEGCRQKDAADRQTHKQKIKSEQLCAH